LGKIKLEQVASRHSWAWLRGSDVRLG